MAKIPTPRSYSAVLSDMVDAFLAKFGLKQLRVGSPVLSILEAAAMSDVRSSQDIFDLLASTNLDRATGTALDRIAADENMARLPMAPSSGTVTVRDGRMAKVSSRIYQGDAAPIAGSDYVLVTDGKGFPDPEDNAPAYKCKIYIGRGTANVEGPLSYTEIKDLGTHWRIKLADSSKTTKFHNVGESVVLAQNGNRTISAGTIAQTAQSSASAPIQFSTLYSATIPDGEEYVENVIVVARQAGESGNVPQNTINSFASAPFAGAQVLNPLPLSNGREAENDTDLRERIKTTRQSRSRGTALSIKNAVLGIVSPQENKRIASASVVNRQGGATTLYIDDGTGYEERASGIALDALNDLALGGEQFFQLSSRAIAKASVKSVNKAPFALATGSKLSVLVGGLLYEHTFLAADFRSIGNASAYEVVASINANPELQFIARTADGGTSIVLTAKQDINEDLQVVAPSEGASANTALLFPTGRAETLRLYKNDRLLSKDGQIAQVRSVPFSAWKSFSGPQNLRIAVDGTPAQTYTFTDQSFAGTGFSKIGKNTAKAWAAVLNAFIPGITAEVNSGAITISSNAGRSSRAKIEILSSDLVANGVFEVCVSQGRANDYALDRNLGQVRLETPLRAGDKLSAGSLSTRAFIESSEIKTANLQDAALMYFAIDGEAQAIKTGVGNSTEFSIESEDSDYSITADSDVFVNVAAGDWLLLWDEAFEQLKGQWRIISKTADSLTIRCEGVTAPDATGIFLSSLGMAIVRFDGAIQKVIVPAGTNYTASVLGRIIGEQLEGATCSVYRTKKLRVRTNTFDQHGSVSLVAANAAAGMIGMQVSASTNYEGHPGSAESGSGAFSMPNFVAYSAGSNSGETDLIDVSEFPIDHTVVGLGLGNDGFSNQAGFSSTVMEDGEDGLGIRKPSLAAWADGDRIYAAAPFAIASEDSVVIVADGDVQTKRFSVPLWKEIKPTGTSYATTNAFKDSANSGQSLTKVFGRGYSFDDHAVLMHARVVVKHTADADAKPDVLFRYKRLGTDGERARVRYVYPSAADQALAVNVADLPDSSAGMTDIDIVLPSGAAVKPSALNSSAVFGYDYAKQTGDLYNVNVRVGFTAVSASIANGVATVKVTLPTGMTAHGLTGTVYFASANPAVISSGVKTITPVGNDSFSFAQTGQDVATIPSPGKVVAGQLPGASFEGVVVGNLISFDSASSAPAYIKGKTVKVTAVAADSLSVQVQAELSVTQTSVTTPVWQAVSDASKIKAFALNSGSCTTAAVVAAINALDDSCPITALALKDTGALSVSGSSSDMAGAPNTWHSLKDGVNWVKATIQPVSNEDDYEFEFKKAVTPSLVSDAGWQSETARIVPITLAAIRNWLSVPAISGLFSACSIEASSSGSKLQLSTLTAGSGGSVQVQGGGANESRAPVVGSASAKAGYMICDVRASDAGSMQAGQWVAVDNAKAQPKTAPTSITSITASGQINLGSPPQTTTTETAPVRFEKQGNFVAIIGISPDSASEGDWLQIESATASAANKGTFRVVRAADSVAWIENANAVEETAQCNLTYITASSFMVGDVVSFNTDALTTTGKWAISEVGLNHIKLQLAQGQSIRPLNTTTAVPSGSMTITEGSPVRLIKHIHSIVPSPRSSAWVSVKFDTDAGHGSVASGAGSVITVLNKLGFANTTSYGIDGYGYSLGLISEANRVVYGDPSDTSTYPGMAAAGSIINISGPVVKRATVSLSIRTRLGVSTSDVSDKVKAAVATAINRSAIGQAIAISDVVKAASRVNGVQAVSILEPTYGAGNDLIPVQPYEKLLVLDVDQDVVVTFVGE